MKTIKHKKFCHSKHNKKNLPSFFVTFPLTDNKRNKREIKEIEWVFLKFKDNKEFLINFVVVT